MNYIVVAGYGWSGSSALVDLLREYEGIICPDIEFRLIKDPYGLSQLETILTQKWDYINADAAINDYLWLCQKCATKSKGLLAPAGLNYLEKLNSQFLDITNEFIKSLNSFCYEGTNYNREFKKSRKSVIIRRLSNAVARRTNGYVNIPYNDAFCNFCRVSKDDFVKACRQYINELFSDVAEGKTIVLDQAVSPLHPEDLHFFEASKMIIVDRDPCDIYLDLMSHQSLIGKTLRKEKSPEKYIAWHNAIRDKAIKDTETVLHIQFEDLVMDYENSVRRVLDFIGWDLGSHVNYKRFFDPSVSAQNINMSPNKYCNASDLDMIRKLLKERNKNIK